MIVSLKHLPNVDELLEKYSHTIIWTSSAMMGLTALSIALIVVFSLIFQEWLVGLPHFEITMHWLSDHLLWLLVPVVISFIGMMTSLKYFVASYQVTSDELSRSNEVTHAIALNKLAGEYEKRGKYDEALPLYRQSLDMLETELGEKHSEVAATLNNLAGVLYAQAQYAEASRLFKRVLQIYEQVLGKQHPNYATSLNNLAELYRARGQYEQALPLFQEALTIKEHVLGKQHPDYATSLNNLALLYQTQGHQYEQALSLYQEALAILTKALGEQHPTTQQVRENYEGCLKQNLPNQLA